MTQQASCTLTIMNRWGVHGRPGMALVDMCRQYQSEIVIQRGSQIIDGKSIMQVMMLAATKGTELVVTAYGADCEQAIQAITRLIEASFDEV